MEVLKKEQKHFTNNTPKDFPKETLQKRQKLKIKFKQERNKGKITLSSKIVHGLNRKYIKIINQIYENSTSRVQVEKIGDKFQIKRGV